MRAAFRQQGFTRLYAGLGASMLGDSIMLLVLSMWVKTLTGSNAMAGLTFFFMVIPAMFGPLLGVLVDRVRRKPLLIWGNIASAVGVLPLVLVRDEGDVWIIFGVAFLYGVSFVVLPAALNGLLKELMPEELLVDANSAIQTTKEAYRLFGPLLGAGLFAWTGGWLVAVVDAASFLVAAAIISTIVVREAAPQREDAHLLAQMSAGVKHLVGDRVLGHVLVGFGITMLVIGFCESAIYALLDAFDKEPTFAGVYVSVMGIGAVTGGLLAAPVIRRFGEVATAALALALLSVGVGGQAVAPVMWLLLCFLVVFGMSLPPLTIAYMTLLQRRTPQALMGRVFTAAEVVMSAPQAISLALGSLLVSFLDYRVMFAIMAGVIGLSACYVTVLLRDVIRAGPLPLEQDGERARR